MFRFWWGPIAVSFRRNGAAGQPVDPRVGARRGRAPMPLGPPATRPCRGCADQSLVGRSLTVALAAAFLGASGCHSADAPAAGNNAAATAPVEKRAALVFAPAQRCPPPRTWGSVRDTATGGIDPVRNRLSIDAANAYYWNGIPIDRVTARQYLELTQQMNPVPLLEVEVDPKTPCNEVTEAIVFIGNLVQCARTCTYRTKAFDRRDIRKPPPPSDTIVLAAMNPAEPGPQAGAPSCGTARMTFVVDGSMSWSPYVDLPPGCEAAVIVPAGEPLRNQPEDLYVKQCRWQGAVQENCDQADGVRFGPNAANLPAGQSYTVHVRIGPIG